MAATRKKLRAGKKKARTTRSARSRKAPSRGARGKTGPRAKATAPGKVAPRGAKASLPQAAGGSDALAVIELPDLTVGARASSAEAENALAQVEDLEASFAVWHELRQAQAASQAQFAAEQRRVAAEGELVLGALEAPALRKPGALSLGKRALKDALEALERQRLESEAEFSRARLHVQRVITARVQARSRHRPVVRLMLRTLAGDRRILHAERPGPDEAVSLLWALAERLPSRYDFLFDDSTDDPTREPPILYPEEGVAAADCRAAPARLFELLAGLSEVWPVKGMLPLTVGALKARWLERGPVMEAEVADGDTWRNVLSALEAEALTGHLLALKVAGRLAVELARG